MSERELFQLPHLAPFLGFILGWLRRARPGCRSITCSSPRACSGCQAGKAFSRRSWAGNAPFPVPGEWDVAGKTWESLRREAGSSRSVRRAGIAAGAALASWILLLFDAEPLPLPSSSGRGEQGLGTPPAAKKSRENSSRCKIPGFCRLFSTPGRSPGERSLSVAGQEQLSLPARLFQPAVIPSSSPGASRVSPSPSLPGSPLFFPRIRSLNRIFTPRYRSPGVRDPGRGAASPSAHPWAFPR